VMRLAIISPRDYPAVGADELLVPTTVQPLSAVGEEDTEKAVIRRVREKFQMMM